ncbi:Uma2 family endonuclease [Micromonospora sp. WMMD1128]|uniref:Uma2 family endonuclease n=1 Tax=unclassified Micromonospora TaxID=2617518 RepID=UPI00248BD8EF|nr:MULTISPECIES: Uma2 family endonuclease [unclassified Micromonospora]WBB74371.1 Uma2 family endonuclease [Micromonospora sp. WMMD1128]WFE32246.1 Uma2 family endonuclease [Micromonospora sp. WMMD975]
MTAAPESFRSPEGGWTTDDLDGLPDEGRRRFELLDGNLIMSPSPTRLHQSIALMLGAALNETCPPDLDVTQGVEVRMSRRRSFIPDLLVTELDASLRNPAKYQPNEVLLVVEIVSEGSRSIDRVLKPTVYAEADIPYFWRIETEAGIEVHAYKLDPVKQVYVEQARMTDGILLPEPWEIDIPLARITPRGR